MAENYLVLAFSMFDRQKKGYISTEDLKEVFEILGESITDEEVNTMIKIAPYLMISLQNPKQQM